METLAITVQVRDAKLANEILKDIRADFQHSGSNCFVFNDKEEYLDALIGFEEAGIILED